MHLRRTLTVRGVLMPLCGLAVLAVGLVVEQLELVGVGVFLCVLPLVSALTVLGAGARVRYSRLVYPPRTHVGQSARVTVRIANTSPLWPVPSLSAVDALPVPLGEEPRFDVGSLGARSVREVSYLVRPQVRGRYPVGPLRVVVGDPLGCVRVTGELEEPAFLLVTPYALPLASVGARSGAQGEHAPLHSTDGMGEQDPVPREYRYGDELRRVHWRSTARHGELMVRRDEQHRREHSVLLLDTRAVAHRGEDAASSLETAVAAAAAVAVRCLRDGHDLSLYDAETRLSAAGVPDVLDGLAVAEPSDAPYLQAGISALPTERDPAPGSVTAVLGALDPQEASDLARVGGRGLRVAVLCTSAAWPSTQALDEAGRVLCAGGWRVLHLSRPDQLPQLWRRAGGSPLPAPAPLVFSEGAP